MTSTCPMLWGPALPKGAMPCLCPRAHCECQAEVPPGACQAAPLTLCSLQTSLAPWLGRGSEHEADAPAVSIPVAFPCPASVPSPARAKPHQGHPQRARTRWLMAVTRSLQPGLGFTVKETGRVVELRFRYCCKLIQDVLELWAGGLGTFWGCSQRKRWLVRGPGAASSCMSSLHLGLLAGNGVGV